MGFTAVLMTIAGLICLVSWVWLLVAAFRVGVVWGLVLFFLAWTLIPVIVFAARNWDEAKRPLILYAAGLTIAAASYVFAIFAMGRELDFSVEDAGPPITVGDSEVAGDDPVLPPPRPTSLPTHASWEAVVSEMESDSEADWETMVPSPTPSTGTRGGLEWDELGSLIGRKVIVELNNGTVTTAALEAVEPHRLYIRHVIGGGEAAYWIERDQISRIRLTY